MDDLDALREALVVLSDPGALAPRDAEPYWLSPRSMNLVLDAARQFLRLMEGAETVEWCLEHKASGRTDTACNPGFEFSESKTCRMVKASLHIREETE